MPLRSLRYAPKVPKVRPLGPPLNSFKTSLRWLKMKNTFFMKKWNVTCKNQVKSHFLINLWKLEDQYRIIFQLALWPEEPREIRFFRKTSRHEIQVSPKNVWKWSEMASENWSGAMETWIRLEIAFRIHWRRSRTPETQFLGRKRIEIRIFRSAAWAKPLNLS